MVQPIRLCQRGVAIKPSLVATVVSGSHAEKAVAGETTGHRCQVRLRGRTCFHRIRQERDQDHAGPPFGEIGAGEVAFAFRGTTLADGEEPGEP